MKNSRILSILLLSCLQHLYGDETLAIIYGTTHLNRVDNSIVGVLITPSGAVLNTEPMGPYERQKILVSNPEAGTYEAYFQTVSGNSFHICNFAGGLVAILCNHPQRDLEFYPQESHVQTFPGGRLIAIGDKTQPAAFITLTEEDLAP